MTSCQNPCTDPRALAHIPPPLLLAQPCAPHAPPLCWGWAGDMEYLQCVPALTAHSSCWIPKKGCCLQLQPRGGKAALPFDSWC